MLVGGGGVLGFVQWSWAVRCCQDQDRVAVAQAWSAPYWLLSMHQSSGRSAFGSFQRLQLGCYVSIASQVRTSENVCNKIFICQTTMSQKLYPVRKINIEHWWDKAELKSRSLGPCYTGKWSPKTAPVCLFLSCIFYKAGTFKPVGWGYRCQSAHTL